MIKVALVQMPAWGIKGPPYSLGCLSAYLKQRGYEVYKRDLNIEVYNAVKNTRYKTFWHSKGVISLPE